MKKLLTILLISICLTALVGCVNQGELESENPSNLVCTVTFDTQGGSLVQSQQVDKGSAITKPQNPTNAGDEDNEYEFKKWTLGGVEFDFDTPIENSITLVAKYQQWGRIVT